MTTSHIDPVALASRAQELSINPKLTDTQVCVRAVLETFIRIDRFVKGLTLGDLLRKYPDAEVVAALGILHIKSCLGSSRYPHLEDIAREQERSIPRPFRIRP